MVIHTQTIFWQKARNCLIVFDHFVRLALTGLKGDSGGFRRKKNLEQFIVFKQSNLVNLFDFFLILKYYLNDRGGSDLK